MSKFIAKQELVKHINPHDSSDSLVLLKLIMFCQHFKRGHSSPKNEKCHVTVPLSLLPMTEQKDDAYLLMGQYLWIVFLCRVCGQNAK